MSAREAYIAGRSGGSRPRNISTGSPGSSSQRHRQQKAYDAGKEERRKSINKRHPTKRDTQYYTEKYSDPRQQLAASLTDAGQVAGNLAFGLFKTAPKGSSDLVKEYLKNPNVFYSTYGKGADAHTTAFQKDLTGYGGLTYSDPDDYDEYGRGYFTPFNPANYPDEYPGFSSFNSQFSGSNSGNYPGGSGNSIALYGAELPQDPKQLGAGEEGIPSTELLDYMIRVNRYNPYTKQAMVKDGGLLSLLR